MNMFLAISQRLANRSGLFWYPKSMFLTNIPERNRFWVDNLGKEFFLEFAGSEGPNFREPSERQKIL